MKQQVRSPRITHLSWGHLDVEGQAAPFKDAKLFPGGHGNGTGAKPVHVIYQASNRPMSKSCWTTALLS